MFVLWCILAMAETPSADALTLQPGLLVQPRMVSNLDVEPSLDLSLRRVRPLLKGNLAGPDVRYFLQAEFAGTPALLDALIDVAATPWLHVRTGRFLVPYSRAQLTPVPKLQFQGFAESTNTQRHGRDVGVQLQAGPTSGKFDATVAVFQGATVDAADPQPIAFARVGAVLLGELSFDETEAALSPSPDFGLAVGLGATAGTETRARDTQILQSQALSGELAASLGAGRLQGEIYARSWQDNASDVGGYLQSSVAWPKPGLELAGRLDLLQTVDLQVTADGLVNWYARGNHLRVSAIYTVQTVAGVVGQVASVQQQLWF